MRMWTGCSLKWRKKTLQLLLKDGHQGKTVSPPVPILLTPKTLCALEPIVKQAEREQLAGLQKTMFRRFFARPEAVTTFSRGSALHPWLCKKCSGSKRQSACRKTRDGPARPNLLGHDSEIHRKPPEKTDRNSPRSANS
ncbi:hypothetical protein N1851_034507 [Merluccius polli]|uniref:Uncharacterized protein n=1 Tax=Merluccius polli TaxID=89951 RepID=A0AA47LZQ0_MERPO|nr:hypothetical protein N1851_034507 [Merluccius polli]